jgi:predicted  nucleic acid-binding Zn-ribbon protein
MAVKSGVRELYDMYVDLRGIQDQLQSAPRKIKARQQLCANKLDQIESTKEQIKKVKAAGDQNNLMVKANEYKNLSLKVKLNQAASNREFDALRSQIDADEMANSVLEDEVLAAFERADRLKAELTQYEAELVALKAAEAKLTQELRAAEAGLKQQAAALQSKIDAAEVIVPAEMALSYKRAVQAHGPDAFAEVEGSQCQACFCSLPQQTYVELKAGRILFCKSCGKVMFPARSAD